LAEAIELIARLFLASVLLLAGLSKLVDRRGARRAIVEFGVARPLAAPLAVVVSVAELATAAALLVGWSLLWGAVVAVASTLIAVLVGGSAAFVQLLRRIRRLLSRNRRLRVLLDALDLCLERAAYRLWAWRARARWPEGLPLGSRAPRFRFPTPEGTLLALDSLLQANKPVVLFFVADPASAVWDDPLAEAAAGAAQAGLPIAVVSRVSARSTSADNDRPPDEVLLQHHWEMLQAYRVYEVPSALVVRPDGTIGSSVANGAHEIRELVAWTVARLASGSGFPARGEPRPERRHGVPDDP
jgi:uncharacterized membrane protein YphA (DoxX/SURF4 family)